MVVMGRPHERHAIAPVAATVPVSELLVSEELTPHRGKKTVEGVATNMVKIQVVCLPIPPLVSALSQHTPALIASYAQAYQLRPNKDTFRPGF